MRERRSRSRLVEMRRTAPEPHVVDHAQILVEPIRVAEQPDTMADPSTIRCQVDTQDLRGAVTHREQPGAQPQQRRLSGAVRATKQDNLAA